MAYQSSGGSLLNDLMPQMKQYRATTGRDMSPQVIQGLLQAKLKADADEAVRVRALDLQQQNQAATQDMNQKTLDLAKRKETISEIGQAGQLAALGTYGYKSLMGPGATKTLPVTAADQAAASGPAVAPWSEVPSAVTPAATASDVPANVASVGGWTDSAGNAISAPTGSASLNATGPGLLSGGGGTGAQVTAGVTGAGETGGVAVGATEAGASAAEIAASEAAATASAESAGAVGGGLLSGTSGAVLPGVGAGLLGGKGGEYLADKWLGGLGIGGQQEKKTGGAVVGGALAGAMAGAAATSWSGPGAIVGAVVGGIVGGIASLF